MTAAGPAANVPFYGPQEVRVVRWGRSPERFTGRMRLEAGLPVEAVAQGRDATIAAGIICTVSGSQTPPGVGSG